MFTITLVLALAADPTIHAFAGTGKKGYAGDGGPATQALLQDPFDVIVDKDGNILFSDTSNHCVRKIDAKTGTITTVAGSGEKGFAGDGGPATKAKLFEPYGIQLDHAGNLYIIDRLNACVRKVDVKTQAISTIAGTGGQKGYSGDGGPADKALLREPNGIALDPSGRFLLIADVADQRIRKVDLMTGIITTHCGNGRKAHGGDGGPYQNATLFGPRAIDFAPDGTLFIVEREGHCVRRIDAKTGIISLYAGTMKKGYSGDGGPAISATFNGPKELAIDANGNLFIVDTENQAIRRIDAKSRFITTVAGCGKLGDTGDDGPATKAGLGRPHGVAVAKDGTLYIGDTLSHKIRAVK